MCAHCICVAHHRYIQMHICLCIACIRYSVRPRIQQSNCRVYPAGIVDYDTKPKVSKHTYIYMTISCIHNICISISCMDFLTIVNGFCRDGSQPTIAAGEHRMNIPTKMSLSAIGPFTYRPSTLTSRYILHHKPLLVTTFTNMN